MRKLLEQAPDWVAPWTRDLHAHGPRMSDAQLEAAARLTTVLLCGEQSAIQVFAREAMRHRQRRHAVADLIAIERDEHRHEQALTELAGYLPRMPDQHRIKRSAQRFFAGLGRVDGLGQRFAQIGQLDTAVCKVMLHVERGSLPRRSALSRVATSIKADEARHVVVARDYARGLGIDLRAAREEIEHVNHQLVDVLALVADSFEAIGVDCDRLFKHIRRVSKA
ncbi:MAG: hypothetical protein AAFX10_16065 [Pseudomonadota bacterium]